MLLLDSREEKRNTGVKNTTQVLSVRSVFLPVVRLIVRVCSELN